MAGRPTDGRSADGRPVRRERTPVPARAGAGPAGPEPRGDGPASRGTARPAAGGRRPRPEERRPLPEDRRAPHPRRPGPLVARPDPVDERVARPVVGAEPGRVRRFVRRYGWRAYAIPLLTVATLVTLVDLALHTPTPVSGGAATSTSTAAPSSSVLVTEPVPEPMVPAEGDAEPSIEPQVVGEETYVERGAGTLSIVDGTSGVLGTGPLQRFIVEIEDGIGVDGATFAVAVESTLGDPRSWGADGRMSFQRVGVAEAAAGQFDFKVSLVSPGSMETYCPGVGTGGYTSCRYGDRAVINLARWATAVPDYAGDVATYRLYVVNHEVGHALGNREHPPCPGPGRLAPVMQQQTLGLDGCLRNPWPYP